MEIKELGLRITCHGVNSSKMPLYITNLYEIYETDINGFSCVALKVKGDIPYVATLKKHLCFIEELYAREGFLILDNISAKRKETLFDAMIPFVTKNKQAYLPFIGTYLKKTNHLKRSDKLNISETMFFIWTLHQKQNPICVSEAKKSLHFSDMTISRSYRALLDHELYDMIKDGRKIYIRPLYKKSEILKKVTPYLSSLCSSYGYIDKKYVSDKMILCGESLLSELTDLSMPKIESYAIYKKDLDVEVSSELIDPANQVKLEIWKYAPDFFTHDKSIDIYSLIVSLKDNNDERIKKEVNKLIEIYDKNR